MAAIIKSKAPKFDDPYKVAENYIDKLFPFFPYPASFVIYDVINKSDFTDTDKSNARYLYYEIRELLTDRFHYTNDHAEFQSDIYLNDVGRDAQLTGGHFAYQQKKRRPTQVIPPVAITNIHHGDNYGQILQGGHQSSFDLTIKNKEIAQPNMSNTRHNTATLKEGVLKKVFSNPWVITVIGGLLIAFLAKLFGWI